MKTTDLSIIIVNYNTKELLTQCLKSVLVSKMAAYSMEIIVVDNSSTDGSAETVKKNFSNVKIIQLSENAGFSAGNNAGVKKAGGAYVLLLNSDTKVNADTLKNMIDFMKEHPDVGAATCKLLLPDGAMDPACHRGFPTPWASFTYFSGLERLFPQSSFFGQYHQGFKDLTKPHEIDSPSGAFFLVRRNVIDKVGLLDEDFFMYGEDLDWAYRIHEAGWKIYFNPEVSTLHLKKQSGRANADAEIRANTRQYFFDTMELFYKKHYAHRYSWLVTQLVFTGIKIRSKL